MVRNSLNYVPWKDRKAVAADLRKIYTAATAAAVEQALLAFKEKWGHQYSTIADIWSRNWQGIIPFLSFPDCIRKAIYTTNAIEAINQQIRKIIKTKGAFPNDEAVFKLVFLALQNASKKWTMPIREWKLALNQFLAIYTATLKASKVCHKDGLGTNIQQLITSKTHKKRLSSHSKTSSVPNSTKLLQNIITQRS